MEQSTVLRQLRTIQTTSGNKLRVLTVLIICALQMFLLTRVARLNATDELMSRRVSELFISLRRDSTPILMYDSRMTSHLIA